MKDNIFFTRTSRKKDRPVTNLTFSPVSVLEIKEEEGIWSQDTRNHCLACKVYYLFEG